MYSRRLLAGLVASFFVTGCATGSLPQGQTPISEVIEAHKHALVRAAEKLVFEEFVKYKELGSTFALYAIGGAQFETSTAVTNSVASQASVQINLLSGGQMGTNTTISVNNQQSGKLTISLSAIGNAPKVYELIKGAFNEAPGRGKIYNLIYVDSAGRPATPTGQALSLEETKKLCVEESFCFSFRDKDGRSVSAYLQDVTTFRTLLDVIRKIEPPAPPPKKEG